MAYYYRNAGSYSNFLQAQSFVGDINRGIGRATSGISTRITEQTKAILASNEALSRQFSSNFNNLNDTLNMTNYAIQSGFQNISNGLSSIENAVGQLGASFDYSIGLVLDQQRITNELLKGLIEVTALPDRERSRLYYIKQAVERYESGLFSEALEAFRNAEQLDITDFKILYRIGVIKLNIRECLDVSNAVEYFSRAARYALARKQTEFASLCALYAGFSSFVLGKDDQALRFCEEAIKLNSNCGEASFLTAKIYALNSMRSDLSVHLEKAIRIDRTYSIKAEADRDFDKERSIVHAVFRKLYDESRREADELLPKISKIGNLLSGFTPVERSYFRDYDELVNNLTNIGQMYNRRTYFDNLDMIRLSRLSQNRIKEVIRRIHG